MKNKKLLSRIILLPLISLLSIPGFFYTAQAGQVVATITGTVASGVVSSGSKQPVFGFQPGTNLAGKNYTLVYTIDDTAGAGTVTVGTPPYSSYLQSTTDSNPITASLAIEGGSVTYGNTPFGSFNGSQVQVARGTGSGGNFQISIGESYNDGYNGGSGNANANIYFTNPVYTPSYNWEAPFSYSFGAGGSGTSTSGSFAYNHTYSDHIALMTLISESANGTLNIAN